MTKQGDPKQAGELLTKMMTQRMKPRIQTFNVLLGAFGKANDAVGADHCMQQLVASGRNVDCQSCNTVISACCRGSNVNLAIKWLNEMVTNSIPIGGSSLAPIIVHFSQKGDVENAKHYHGFLVDVVGEASTELWNAVLSAYSQPNEALDWFNLMPTKNLATYNSLLKVFAKVGDVDSCKHYLFNIMPSANIVSYNTCLHACAKTNDQASANEIMAAMKKANIKPDTITTNSIVDRKPQTIFGWNSTTTRSPFSSVRQFSTSAHTSNTNNNTNTSTNVIDTQDVGKQMISELQTHIKNMDERSARHVYDKMVGLEIQPSFGVYNMFIQMYAKKGHTRNAEEFFNTMLNKKLQPTVITYGSMLHAYSLKGDVKNCIRYFDMMLSKRITPNRFAFNHLMNAHLKSSNPTGAIEVLENMPKYGIKPDVISHNILINGLCKKNEMQQAVSVINRMENAGLKPDEYSYGGLINAFCLYSKPASAVVWLDRLQKADFIPTQNLMSNVLTAFCKLEMSSTSKSVLQTTNFFDDKMPSNYKNLSAYNNVLELIARNADKEDVEVLQECGKSQDVELAEKYYNTMVNGGMFPDDGTYTSMLELYSKKGTFFSKHKIQNHTRKLETNCFKFVCLFLYEKITRYGAGNGKVF